MSHDSSPQIANSVSLRALLARAKGLWICILLLLAPQLRHALERIARHVPCPVHGGKDGFRTFPDVAETGGGCCNTCGNFPNGILLLEWVNNWSRSEVVRKVEAVLRDGLYPGLIPEAHPPSLAGPIKENPFHARRLQQVWEESLPGDHPDAVIIRTYFQNRGLSRVPIPSCLRYNPALDYYQDGQLIGRFPAMVAVVSDPDGRPVCIHRTYLTATGEKAPVSSPKKLMHPTRLGATKGGAIRLFEAGYQLIVAEGIETALSAHLDTGIPAWAAVSAGGMEGLILPEQVGEIIICADHDPKEKGGRGQIAAERLAERLYRENVVVYISEPPIPGMDWNDALKGGLDGAFL